MIPLIFPKVPQSSLVILRVPQLPPLKNPTNLGTFLKAKPKNGVTSSLEPSYFPLYLLFNRDPYNGLL